MTERKDLEDLAKEFVDLWQEHLALQASDPALTRWIQAWLAALPAGAPGDGAVPERAAAPGDAPGPLVRRLDEFARRLARCEERLDSLERNARGAGRADTKRSRRGGC